jgi:23S rRNA (guanosine2251-2'-O)-methyltransferase
VGSQTTAAEKNGRIPSESLCNTVTADFIDARTGGQSHGGVVAEVGPRRFLPLADLLPSTNVPFIVMLDGIEDPFNFGQAIRALYAAGADGLVVRPRNWLSAAGIVARASAGTAELMPTGRGRDQPGSGYLFPPAWADHCLHQR